MKKYCISAAPLAAAAIAAMMSAAPASVAAPALDASYYTPVSVLDSGRWVKVKVRGSGMHQITDAELAAMGFTQPEKVAVYGYGASLLSDNRLTAESPDDLPPVPSMRVGGKMVFYAEGDLSLALTPSGSGASASMSVSRLRNYYCDYSTYFLTDSRPAVAPAIVPLADSYASMVTHSFGIAYSEEELTNPGEFGAPFLGPDFSRERRCVMEFDMPAYNPGGASGADAVTVDLGMAVQSANSNQLRIILPSGETRTTYISQSAADVYAYVNCSRFYTDSPAASPSDTYSVTVDGSSLSLNYAAVDYMAVAYPRVNRLAGLPQETLHFRTLAASDRIEISNATESTMVWDITDRVTPRAFEVAPSSGSGTIHVSSPGAFSAASGTRCVSLIAFDPLADLPGVEPAGEVSAQNLHALSAPRMLIVASSPFMAEAERLAQAHRSIEGKDVMVVNQQDIFNEFSSGTPHIMGIRRFARMLYDRSPGVLRSVLLFGPASYDNRGYTSLLDTDTFHDTYIPMYQREDLSGAGKHAESYSTDAVPGMLAEDTGAFDIGRSFMTVAVGRIPASDIADAKAYVDKALEMMAEPPAGDYRNRALLMCDDGDANGHMADANGVADIIASCSPSTTVYRAYNTIYPFDNGRATELNRAASQVLSKGVAYWAYSGHATPRFFGSEQIWSITKSNEETYDIKPFVMLATCRALHYDHREENIGEAMLYNRSGGAIALVGALRSVYKEYNQLLNLEVAREFYTAPAGTTYGDIFLNARNRLVPVTGSPATDSRYYDVIYNTLSYNYIGDPELTPAQPAQTVAVTAVNGVSPEGDAPFEVGAGEMMTVAGEVLGADGSADTSFSGTVTLSLFDGPNTVNVVNVDATSSTSDTVTLDEDIMVEQKARVTEGRFSTSFYVPVPMRQGGPNRLTLYAQASDNPSRQASGVAAPLAVVDRGTQELPGSESAPVISSIYLDSSDFRDGDTFTSAPVLYAEVAPNAMGVTGLSSHIGKSLAIFLDDSHAYATASGYFTPGEDGGGSLEFPLTGLADGRHTLTLRVFNNAGQMASRTISFVMVNVQDAASVIVDGDPRTGRVEFSLAGWEHDAPQARVIVRDGTGKAVFVDPEASFPYSWELHDAEGAPVEEGPYTVETYLRSGQRYGSAVSAPFAVIRR